MTLPNLAGILDVIAVAAQRGEPLSARLRASGLAGAATVANRLDDGADLPSAFRGLAPVGVLRVLSDALPELERRATLAATAARDAVERRLELLAATAYPLLVALAAAGAFATFLYWSPVRPDGAWLWLAVPPLLVVVAAALVPHLGDRWLDRLPLVAAAERHRRLQRRYERAALAARWRLPEADAQRLLGVDLAPIAAQLGHADAEAHCQRLAAIHAVAARAAQERLGRVIAGCVLGAIGAAVLAVALGMLHGYLALCQAQ
jgi:hypothetical protein